MKIRTKEAQKWRDMVAAVIRKWRRGEPLDRKDRDVLAYSRYGSGAGRCN